MPVAQPPCDNDRADEHRHDHRGVEVRLEAHECAEADDDGGHVVCLASAGHQPVLLVEPDGTTGWIDLVATVPVGVAGQVGLDDEVFDLDERARGFTAAGLEGVAQFVGLMFGIPLSTRLMAKGPQHVLRFLGRVSFGIAALWVVFALAPTLPVAIVANGFISAGFFLLIPGIFVTLSLAVPAKVRSFGFAIGTLFILPGLVLLPVIGWVADEYSIRTGLVVAAPSLLETLHPDKLLPSTDAVPERRSRWMRAGFPSTVQR